MFNYVFIPKNIFTIKMLLLNAYFKQKNIHHNKVLIIKYEKKKIDFYLKKKL